MPSFGGNSIFGEAVKMRTKKAPRSAQENEYFGLTGIESLDGGGRGYITVVTGLFIAESRSALGSLFITLGSYSDGVARDLYDTKERTSVMVKLIGVDEGDMWYDPGVGYGQSYTATFQHLI